MVLPLIVIFIAGALIYKNWDQVLINLKGKKLVILGEKKVGKTTLNNFLRGGEIPLEHQGTTKEKANKNLFKLKDLDLALKEGVDIGGPDDFLEEWKQFFNDSDLCFYLFNAKKVYEKDSIHLEKVERHLTHIKKWSDNLKLQKKNVKVYLIGTFADQIDDFNQYRKGNFQEFESLFRQSLEEARLQGGIVASAIFVGSLSTKEERDHLIFRVLTQIQNEG